MRLAVGAAALVALLFAAVPAAQAQTLTIEVTSVTTVVNAHDLAPKGKPNAGDRINFRDLLLNRKPQFGKKTGKAVAYDVGVMTYTSRTDTKLSAVATFPGVGTITFAGPFVTRKDGTTVIPITGGTGGFRGATGTVTIGAGATKAPNIYVITVPHRLNIDAPGGIA
jgi:hypothetical protein